MKPPCDITTLDRLSVPLAGRRGNQKESLCVKDGNAFTGLFFM